MAHYEIGSRESPVRVVLFTVVNVRASNITLSIHPSSDIVIGVGTGVGVGVGTGVGTGIGVGIDTVSKLKCS